MLIGSASRLAQIAWSRPTTPHCAPPAATSCRTARSSSTMRVPFVRKDSKNARARSGPHSMNSAVAWNAAGPAAIRGIAPFPAQGGFTRSVVSVGASSFFSAALL